MVTSHFDPNRNILFVAQMWKQMTHVGQSADGFDAVKISSETQTRLIVLDTHPQIHTLRYSL